MRIDREGFLLAVAALAGCERAEPSPTRPAPTADVEAQRPGASASLRAPATEPATPPTTEEPVEPVAEVTPMATPPPTRTAAHHRRSAAKRWFLGLAMEQRNNVTAACAHRAEVQCRAVLRAAMPPPTRVDDDPGAADPPADAEPVVDQDEAKVAQLPSTSVAQYCREEFPAPTCETPLVVAFDGQPIDFAPASGDPFAFVPGEPAATDWPTATTPWIALDLDGDGAITSGAELFGSSTVLANGSRASNGFAALAALDANGDGILDARDPMFARLVLWSDRNGDHRSTPDELRPLASTVTSISLAFTLDPRCNQRDDCEGERAALHWRDAAGVDHVGAVVDVYIPRRGR
jgi:hypothetical protein